MNTKIPRAVAPFALQLGLLLVEVGCTARATSTPAETCDENDQECALKTAASCDPDQDKDCESTDAGGPSQSDTQSDTQSDNSAEASTDSESSPSSSDDIANGGAAEDPNGSSQASGEGGSSNQASGGAGGSSPGAQTDAGQGGGETSNDSGGQGGLSGQGGAEAQGGVGGRGDTGASAGGAPPCGSQHAGSLMTLLEAGAGDYCIDSFEVSRQQYAEFLDSAESVSLPASCAYKTDHTPGDLWPISGDGDRSIAFVDWCDAVAYCTWAGKRLCGAIGGGSLGASPTDSTSGQWQAACSSDGTSAYPYGPNHNPRACVGVDYDGLPGYTVGSDQVLTSGSATSCRGTSNGYDQVFDMSGNVAEWEDACASDLGADDTCRARGGDFWTGTATTMRCRDAIGRTRNFRGVNVGFRCCSDL